MAKAGHEAANGEVELRSGDAVARGECAHEAFASPCADTLCGQRDALQLLRVGRVGLEAEVHARIVPH